MTTPTRYVWTNQFITTELEDGLVALMFDSGKYFQCKGPTSKAIWQLLEEPRTIDEMVGLLMGRFKVPLALCLEETSRYIAELEAAGLIKQHVV